MKRLHRGIERVVMARPIGLCGLTVHRRRAKTPWPDWFAWATIAVPACCRICLRARFAVSAAKSASRMRERDADRFSEITCRLSIKVFKARRQRAERGPLAVDKGQPGIHGFQGLGRFFESRYIQTGNFLQGEGSAGESPGVPN